MAVMMASLAGDAIIWTLVRQSLWNEAFLQAYQNTYMTITGLEEKLSEDAGEEGTGQFFTYYLKKQRDDYNICLCTTEDGKAEKELYNHTVLEAEELLQLEYTDYTGDYILRSGSRFLPVDYALLKKEGRNYLVFRWDSSQYNVLFLRIEDVTYVWEKMERLAFYLLVITAGVTAVTILAVLLVLKRVLRPLRELNDTARHIAEGNYEKRLLVKSRDEIGQLGENFNKMAEAVEVRTRSLEESEQKKTLFMGNLTHELKTPMTAISGYSQTLLSMKLSEEDRQEALHYIYEECGRLERLSRKMMKLLELDQEEELKLTDMPVSDIFAAAERACAVILREKELQLEVVWHGEIFPMDADLMTDVVINLIDNAAKASSPGGRILLEAYEKGIRVQDFGRGIPEEEQEKILEPFYMVDKSRSRKSGGAGLGLYLVALVARLHGARLRIESKEGEGTCVELQMIR